MMILVAQNAYTKGSAFSLQLGYAPEIGGSMHSGWQEDNLGNHDGINDINRSASGTDVSTVEKPVGVILALNYRSFWDAFYFKTGLGVVYSFYGGEGTTLNNAGTEIVDVSYTLLWGEIPFIFGVYLDFWDEVRISLGAGVAVSYGLYMNSFKSSSLSNSGVFYGYGFPLMAEFNCEYRFSEKVDFITSILYSRGETRLIENGDDYARIDFTSFRILAGLTRRIGF